MRPYRGKATVLSVEVAQSPFQNLSDTNVTRRLRVGIVMLMVALALAAVFEKLDASPLTRLWLFLPFFLAENAFFQAIHKTCGFSAMKGMRHTAEGDERIADRAELDACRCRGRLQLMHSLCAAAALTALFIWIG